MSARVEWKTSLGADFATTDVAPVAPSGKADDDHAAVLERAGFDQFLHGHALGPITVVVNDTHRMTDTRSFLVAMLAAVDRVFPSDKRPELRMLVAAGTHKSDRMERSAHEERMAAPFLKRFTEVAWHDADDKTQLRDVGGFELHRWMGEHGTYVACGSAEPHYFAGVTGAHKTLTVGVMSRAGIEKNHAGAMQSEATGFALEGNPVHAGVVAAIRALESSRGRLFALNQVLVGGRVVGLSAGSPLTALHAAVPLVRRVFGHRVDTPFDCVIACVEPPLDRDLYQADKGIKNTEAGVREGGVLILDAACERGVGIDHFVGLLRSAPTYVDSMLIISGRGYRLGDHKAVKLRALRDNRHVRLAVVSPHLDAALAPVLGMEIFKTRTDAAAWARALLGSAAAAAKPRALVVEDAGNLTLEIATS
jgi:nickel-dependent lactate racemase